MKESVLDKVKGIINRNKPSNKLILHKRIRGADWYMGFEKGNCLMVKDVEDAVDLSKKRNLQGVTKEEWLEFANKRFAKNWRFVIIDKNGEFVDE